MTAFGTIAKAREAFRLGADDFVQKPFSNDELMTIVDRALERRALVAENRVLKQAQRSVGSLQNLVGESAVMKALFDLIRNVSNERSTVLVTGESGTGKELVARAIHDLSERSERPFVPVNCGAMAESLLESELFGFMKGSFTGAEKNQVGVFEAANNGTIFLDEIGDMPMSMQVKMLRVLQDGKIRRIGSQHEVEVDARVIAATNCDLGPMIESGRFRQDLFYRISVIPIHVPALRERPEDIPILIEHFVRKFSSRSAKKVSISDSFVNVLSGLPWFGNVRELEHTIERAVALAADGRELVYEGPIQNSFGERRDAASLPYEGLDLRDHLDAVEKELVEKALTRLEGNVKKAAESLRVPAHAFGHLLRKHGIAENSSDDRRI